MYSYRPLTLAALSLTVMSTATGALPAEQKRDGAELARPFILPVERKFPSLAGADAWLNSERLTPEALRGKVVLVDFWTYTCINWRRTAPYLRAWAEKYKDQGLVVIGVHSPEFSFEKNLDNVRRQANEQRIDYPVAVDSGHEIWHSFHNEYWPALYFIDAQGRVRHHVFGEGQYEESERIIQQLLAEAGRTVSDHRLVAVDPDGAEAAADWKNLRSPETYLGYERAERSSSSVRPSRDGAVVYVAPARLPLNEWSLSGQWHVKREYVQAAAAHAKVTYRFHARDIHLVMGPGPNGTPVRFRVLIDGQPPGTAHGVDVDDAGRGTLHQPRMYQLIRQPTPIEDRDFEIEFLDDGAEVFSFTFG